MNKTNIITITILTLILLVSSVYAADLYYENLDLENYPNFLVSNSRFDFKFVMGEFAQSSDALATAEIAQSLVKKLDKIASATNKDSFEIDITSDSNIKEELTNLYMDVLNKDKDSAAQTILDTSLNFSTIKNKNLIVVGGPCVNSVAAYFYGYPEDCAEGFAPGRGKIQLFRNGKGIAMVVAGFTAEDTQTAARILSNYEDYLSNFVGESLKTSSAWITELKFSQLNDSN